VRGQIRKQSSKLFSQVQDTTLPLEERRLAFEQLANQIFGEWQSPFSIGRKTLRAHCEEVAAIAMSQASNELGVVFDFGPEDVAHDLMLAIFMLAPTITNLRAFINKTAVEMIDGSFARNRASAASAKQTAFEARRVL